MSSEMKLIMENWRNSEVVSESEGIKAANDILDDLEKEQQLDEAIFSVAAIIFAFFVKTAAASAMVSAIAKFGSFLQKKLTGDPSSLLDNIGLYAEQASKHLATLGIPAGFAKIMQHPVVRNYLGDDEATKWSNWFRQVEKVLAFLILITAAGHEIFVGIKEAGGGIEMIKQLAQKSGIQDPDSLSALADLFDRLVDGGELTATSVEASNQQGRLAIWGTIVKNLKDLVPKTP
tara:strand:+ start:253 stop:951 length:699 start_codon:yes stop_codon:yes gene_type:complete